MFILISGLVHPENAFMTVNPVDDDAVWSARVSLLGNGDYEVDRSAPGRHEHNRATTTDPGLIAHGLTVWPAGRFPPL